jgi:flagellar protein FlaG
MPINPLSNFSVVSVSTTAPSAPTASTPASAASTGEVRRQDLPGSGQTAPAASQSAAPSVLEQDVQKMRDDVEQAVEHLSSYVQNIRRDLQFTVDEDSGRTVVKVVDSETGDLIRQIPSAEILAISKAISENMGRLSGLFVLDQA